MHRSTLILALIIVFHCALAAQVSDTSWPIHSLGRTQPAVVKPGLDPGGAPSDAIILFDGINTNGWQTAEKRPVPWAVHDGVLEVKPGTGNIETVQPFGDCQLHLEWAEPAPPNGNGEERGNSGVILMGLYEVQVLDSYENSTYPDGTVGAIYGQYPPLVNVARPAGEWQSYDIVFRRPHFDASGRLLRTARITVLQNGVLIQDAASPTGPTSHSDRAPYIDLGDRLPLILQEHGAPVRFRNIWLRPLPSEPEPLPATSVVVLKATDADLRAFVGSFTGTTTRMKVAPSENGLEANFEIGYPSIEHPNFHYGFSIPLYLTEQDTFLAIAPNGGLPLHLGFVQGPVGVYNGAVIHWGGFYETLVRQP